MAVSHRFCESAIPVPKTIPTGGKYRPSEAKGQDFDTGDTLRGWNCLKFMLVEAHHYQYDYRRG